MIHATRAAAIFSMNTQMSPSIVFVNHNIFSIEQNNIYSWHEMFTQSGISLWIDLKHFQVMWILKPIDVMEGTRIWTTVEYSCCFCGTTKETKGLPNESIPERCKNCHQIMKICSIKVWDTIPVPADTFLHFFVIFDFSMIDIEMISTRKSSYLRSWWVNEIVFWSEIFYLRRRRSIIICFHIANVYHFPSFNDK